MIVAQKTTISSDGKYLFNERFIINDQNEWYIHIEAAPIEKPSKTPIFIELGLDSFGVRADGNLHFTFE